jgi:hypothetical protein
MLLPNMRVEIGLRIDPNDIKAGTKAAIQLKSSNVRWDATLYVCMQCGATQIFTLNPQDIAKYVTNSGVVTAR